MQGGVLPPALAGFSLLRAGGDDRPTPPLRHATRVTMKINYPHKLLLGLFGLYPA
jgi:hypothetical protein